MITEKSHSFFFVRSFVHLEINPNLLLDNTPECETTIIENSECLFYICLMKRSNDKTRNQFRHLIFICFKWKTFLVHLSSFNFSLYLEWIKLRLQRRSFYTSFPNRCNSKLNHHVVESIDLYSTNVCLFLCHTSLSFRTERLLKKTLKNNRRSFLFLNSINYRDFYNVLRTFIHK